MPEIIHSRLPGRGAIIGRSGSPTLPEEATHGSLLSRVDPLKPNDSDVVDGQIPIFTCGMLAMGALVLAVGLFVGWLALTGQMRLE